MVRGGLCVTSILQYTWYFVNLNSYLFQRPPQELISLGLPRVCITKTPSLSFQNAKQRYTALFCQLTVHLTKSAIEGILQAQQNQEGDYRYCHGIPLFGKNCDVLIFKMPKTVYHWFSSQITVFQPVYGTVKRRNQDGDTDVPFTVTVYRFMAKKSRFFSCLGFWWRIFFLLIVVAKNVCFFSSSSIKCTVQQIHVVPKHRKGTWPRNTEHTWQTPTTRSHEGKESSNRR